MSKEEKTIREAVGCLYAVFQELYLLLINEEAERGKKIWNSLANLQKKVSETDKKKSLKYHLGEIIVEEVAQWWFGELEGGKKEKAKQDG